MHRAKYFKPYKYSCSHAKYLCEHFLIASKALNSKIEIIFCCCTYIIYCSASKILYFLNNRIRYICTDGYCLLYKYDPDNSYRNPRMSI